MKRLSKTLRGGSDSGAGSSLAPLHERQRAGSAAPTLYTPSHFGYGGDPSGDNNGASERTGFPVAEYIAIFRRHKMLLIETFVVAVLAGLIITHFTKPVYQATAKVEVDSGGFGGSTDSNNPLSALFSINDQQPVDTQLELLTTQSLLNEAQREAGKVDLSADVVGQTSIIEVNGEASTPQAAANGANDLVNAYMASLSSAHGSEITSAKNFVVTRASSARQQLTAAEDALRNFKERNHIADIVASRNDQIAQVDKLQGDLQATQLAISTDREQLSQYHSQLAVSPTVAQQTTYTSNPVINADNNAIAQLQVQRDAITTGPTGYTKSDYRVRTIDAQIARLKAQIAAQPTLLPTVTRAPSASYAGLQSKIGDTQVQIATLSTRAQDLTGSLAQALLARFPTIEAQFTQLTQAVDDAASADKMYSGQYQDLSLREKTQHVPVHIVEAATVPTEPIRPKPLHDFLLSCIAGLILGLVATLGREYSDNRIHKAADAEMHLNLPALGEIRLAKPNTPLFLPELSPHDPMVESYRIIRTGIQFAAVDKPIRSVMISSSTPREGKSTVALNLAFAAAMDGKHVIVVDADLRRPNLHQVLEFNETKGLSDVMIEQANLDETLIGYGGELQIELLPAGTQARNPSELLGSHKFAALVRELEDRCDLLIIDTAPMLVFSDTRRIAPSVDAVLLVVAAGATTRDAAKTTINLLRRSQANPIGLVLNKVTAPDGVLHDQYLGGYAVPGYVLPATDWKSPRAGVAGAKAPSAVLTQGEE